VAAWSSASGDCTGDGTGSGVHSSWVASLLASASFLLSLGCPKKDSIEVVGGVGNVGMVADVEEAHVSKETALSLPAVPADCMCCMAMSWHMREAALIVKRSSGSKKECHHVDWLLSSLTSIMVVGGLATAAKDTELLDGPMPPGMLVTIPCCPAGKDMRSKMRGSSSMMASNCALSTPKDAEASSKRANEHTRLRRSSCRCCTQAANFSRCGVTRLIFSFILSTIWSLLSMTSWNWSTFCFSGASTWPTCRTVIGVGSLWVSVAEHGDTAIIVVVGGQAVRD